MDKKLYEIALDVKKKAYAPYSNFHVGAAVKSTDGKIYTGCNVENASYGLTVCAERNAIGKMVSEGETKFSEIYIVGDTEEILPPCGACRQVLKEFAADDAKVFMFNNKGDFKEATMDDILPFGFTLKK